MIFQKKAANKKWQKRPHLYKGRFYYIRKTLQMLLAVAVVSGIFFGFYYLNNSDEMTIQKIIITNKSSENVKTSDVIKLSELKKDDKLFSVSLKRVTRKILRHPWIKDVMIRREFPNTLQIDYVEREPLAILDLGTMYLIDQDGDVFQSIKNQKKWSLPVITGFSKKWIENYPTLTRLYFKEALGFLKVLQTKDIYKEHQIKKLDFHPIQGMTVVLTKQNLEIFYGNERFNERHLKLEKIFNEKHFDISQLNRLDLEPKNKVIAKLIDPKKLNETRGQYGKEK